MLGPGSRAMDLLFSHSQLDVCVIELHAYSGRYNNSNHQQSSDGSPRIYMYKHAVLAGVNIGTLVGHQQVIMIPFGVPPGSTARTFAMDMSDGRRCGARRCGSFSLGSDRGASQFLYYITAARTDG